MRKAKQHSILLVALCGEGGVTRYIELLADRLIRRGHKVTVCIPDGPWARQLRSYGFEVVSAPLCPDPRNLFKAYKLLAALVENGIDVVHANSSAAGFVVGILALTHPGHTYVFSPHLLPFATHAFGRLRRALYWIVMRSLIWVYDQTICCCKWERSDCLKRLRLKEHATQTIVHGVPLQTSADYTPGMVLCQARLVPVKGIDVLVRAARAVVDREPSVQFEILGEGHCRKRLEALIQELNLASNVHLRGYVPDVGPWLQRSHIACLPSWSEAMPFSVLEAMCYGVPVVATSVGGVPEIVEKDCGVLVPPGNPQAIAESILHLLTDKQARQELSRNCQKRIAASFSVEGMVENTLRCYEGTLRGDGCHTDSQTKGELTDTIVRVTDIVLSVTGLLLCGPVIALACIAVFLESGLPVFYTQERVGRGWRRFRIIKIRTMRKDAEKRSGAIWASEHDSRATRVGSILRKLNIDELPQLINIIKGEMSIVGPRPERPLFVRVLRKHLPGYAVRCAVRPGLTGWSQAHGYRGRTSISKRTRADIWFIRHYCLLTYWLALFSTVLYCISDMRKQGSRLWRRVLALIKPALGCNDPATTDRR